MSESEQILYPAQCLVYNSDKSEIELNLADEWIKAHNRFGENEILLQRELSQEPHRLGINQRQFMGHAALTLTLAIPESIRAEPLAGEVLDADLKSMGSVADSTVIQNTKLPHPLLESIQVGFGLTERYAFLSAYVLDGVADWLTRESHSQQEELSQAVRRVMFNSLNRMTNRPFKGKSEDWDVRFYIRDGVFGLSTAGNCACLSREWPEDFRADYYKNIRYVMTTHNVDTNVQLVSMLAGIGEINRRYLEETRY